MRIEFILLKSVRTFPRSTAYQVILRQCRGVTTKGSTGMVITGIQDTPTDDYEDGDDVDDVNSR